MMGVSRLSCGWCVTRGLAGVRESEGRLDEVERGGLKYVVRLERSVDVDYWDRGESERGDERESGEWCREREMFEAKMDCDRRRELRDRHADAIVEEIRSERESWVGGVGMMEARRGGVVIGGGERAEMVCRGEGVRRGWGWKGGGGGDLSVGDEVGSSAGEMVCQGITGRGGES
ncbi:hypothetical protein Tco_0071150 [Tanacetum coccineum]